MNPSGGTGKADYIGQLTIEKDKAGPDKTKISGTNGKPLEPKNVCA